MKEFFPFSQNSKPNFFEVRVTGIYFLCNLNVTRTNMMGDNLKPKDNRYGHRFREQG
ncbi:hypothetical protein LEP1GSC052_3961 [Leptospira kmetyi serovar Malaysia str. Bejo-Iso9]|nr:hypothetical protein LEP1GSC052_3961 [Leptospira kmetyi serovar Malaysia str. Bejo-Iso9]